MIKLGSSRQSPAPLLFRIALDQGLIDVPAHQRNGLLFQVLGFSGDLPALRFDLRRSLLRRHHAPHLIKCVHIEGQGIELPFVIRHRRIGKAVERRKLIHIVPNLGIIGVENMRAVLVDLNALDFLRIDISGNMVTLINDQHRFPVCFRLLRKNRAIQPAPTTR